MVRSLMVLALVLSCLFLAPYAVAQSGLTAHLSWPNLPEDQQVKWYTVYKATVSGGYDFSMPYATVMPVAGTVHWDDPNLPQGRFFWVVQAVNVFDQASLPSNEVSANIPAVIRPPNVTINTNTLAVQLFVDGVQTAMTIGQIPGQTILSYTLPKFTPPTARQLQVQVTTN